MTLCKLLLLSLFTSIGAVDRVYYIGIVEEVWDYAPTGSNLITGVNLTDDPDAAVFYEKGPNRIGGKYKKAIYKEYTDETYTKEIPKDPTLGYLGPTLTAEVGDNLIIYAKNFAKYNFSLHPHGARYAKSSEGALYMDSTPTDDQSIPPQGSRRYKWIIDVATGPYADDPECITWIYHSHINTLQDTYSGLVGGMVICNKGVLGNSGKRTDVDRSYVLNFYVIDENLSWYIDENIQTYCTDPASVNKDDPDFQESNTMHGINGLGYGNLQGLEACEGDKIAWHVFGFGNEVDIHSAHFEKQTFVESRHRQDTVNLFAAVFTVLTMEADNPGISLISCKVNDHYSAGMLTSFNVSSSCGSPVASGDINSVKKYYIGIMEDTWNYGPSGNNQLTGENLTADGTQSQTFFLRGEDRVGGTYKKAMFYQYENENFTDAIVKEAKNGLLGPLIAVEIGDVIEVTLKNMATRPYNIEPHGLLYNDTTAVQPNSTYTFTWRAPDNVSPTDLDPDCVTYLYTSSVNPVKDTNSGLVGPLMVCKRGTLADAMARKAYYLLFTVMDENQSHYLDENIQLYTTAPNSVSTEDEDFQESNLMHSINGLMFGNLETIQLCVNEETDFHVIGLGTEVDMHSMFMSGVNIRVRQENTAVVSVFPQTTSSTTVVPEKKGTGQIRCVVSDHLIGGMITGYEVTDCGTSSTSAQDGRTLTYYIAAVEENWDYAPQSRLDILGRSLDDSDTPGYTFAHQKNGSMIGSVYKKAMYFQYTDSTFTKRMEKPSHLGVMGPVISAEEGDTINIVFKNMASIPYSIKPWGARDENDPFNMKTGGVVAGKSTTYKWTVPSSAVPPKDQPGCSSWIYRSNVNEEKDVNTGMIGPLLLCRKGSLSSSGGTDGVDAEFYLLFIVFDENKSHYLNYNIEHFANADATAFNTEDEAFEESNLLHGINGVIYGLPGLVMNYQDDVIWHLIGYGNEVDIHTAHFHAHTFKYISDITSNGDVFELFPGKIGTVEMRTTEPGTWLMHCHVDDHIEAGMITTYTVNEKPEDVDDGLAAWVIAVIVIGSVAGTAVIIGFIYLFITKGPFSQAGFQRGVPASGTR